jgi:hypothetical protein
MSGVEGEILSAALDAAYVVGVSDAEPFGEIFLRPRTISPQLRDASSESDKGARAAHTGTFRPRRTSETTYRKLCVSLRGRWG